MLWSSWSSFWLKNNNMLMNSRCFLFVLFCLHFWLVKTLFLTVALIFDNKNNDRKNFNLDIQSKHRFELKIYFSYRTNCIWKSGNNLMKLIHIQLHLLYRPLNTKFSGYNKSNSFIYIGYFFHFHWNETLMTVTSHCVSRHICILIHCSSCDIHTAYCRFR